MSFHGAAAPSSDDTHRSKDTHHSEALMTDYCSGGSGRQIATDNDEGLGSSASGYNQGSAVEDKQNALRLDKMEDTSRVYRPSLPKSGSHPQLVHFKSLGGHQELKDKLAEVYCNANKAAQDMEDKIKEFTRQIEEKDVRIDEVMRRQEELEAQSRQSRHANQEMRERIQILEMSREQKEQQDARLIAMELQCKQILLKSSRFIYGCEAQQTQTCQKSRRCLSLGSLLATKADELERNFYSNDNAWVYATTELLRLRVWTLY
jgi:hypothetical protein